MEEKWMKWTLLESLMKTSSKLLQKVIGLVSTTIGHTFFAVMVVGIVQVMSGFAVVRFKKKELLTDWQSILGSCLFGVGAVICTVLAFCVFLLGGDIGINVFIITLSIIPGALIDRVFFNHKLNKRQWLGILIAIFAGYSILGWPSLAEALRLPLWVWLSFGIS